MEHKLIMKALVGSHAHGTSTPESDYDYKGIYKQNNDDILSYGYEEFVRESKDEIYYEVKRFIDLLCVANPEALELLFSPDDCILQTSPEFEILRQNKHIFLTKKCADTFGGYANMQIKKASGLDKKINWESQRVERKTPLDFCFVSLNGKTMPLNIWLSLNNYEQEYCGLINLKHFKDVYALYYDEHKNKNYRGLIKNESNELRLSEIPKGEVPVIDLYYNKDGYTAHCKDYKSYQTWLKERNTNRYHTNKSHGQLYDSKNLSHCRRLIDVAIEIAKTGNINVRRPENEIEYLLEIKRGDVPLKDIMTKAEEDIKNLKNVYSNSNLPDEVDMKIVKNILLQIRKYNDSSKNNPE